MNLEQLKEPFAPSDVSWRIGQCGKKRDGKIYAKVLAYIDNRNIQERLDSVVGPASWKNEYTKGPEGGVLCGLSIKVDGEWITKWDGAENSDIEPIKGGLSDSMKRAAVQWGIGRYLYELGENFADIVEANTKGRHWAKTKDGDEFFWLPPRDVLPEVAKARAAAEEHGLTTGDKVQPPPKERATFDLALKEIEKCVRNRDSSYLKVISRGIKQRVSEGKITKEQDAALCNELAIAERKIEALEKEPAAA